jgi:DNA-binding response OmpR family regulator
MPMRVLVVDDEKNLVHAVEHSLVDLGYSVTCAHLLEEALQVANDETFDAALLDVNLGNEVVYPLADLLAAHGTQLIFATARKRKELPERFRRDPLIVKPYDLSTVLGELRAVQARAEA